MTKPEDIIEGNRLIVEFFGWKLDKCNQGQAWTTPYSKAIEDKWSLHGRLHRSDYSELRYLNFHHDWNLLMQVIDKIESIKVRNKGAFAVIITGTLCQIDSTSYIKSTKIEAVWSAVVSHIKWYNQQQKG